MNTNINNTTDRILKHAIGAVTPESPGENFVSTVMQKIELISQKRSAKNDPLISWKGWLLIGIISATMFSLVFLTDTSSISLDTISKYYDDFVASYLSMFLSRLFGVSMVILAILFLIQIRLVISRIDRIQKAGTDN